MLAGDAVGIPRVQVRAARSSERCAGAALTPLAHRSYIALAPHSHRPCAALRAALPSAPPSAPASAPPLRDSCTISCAASVPASHRAPNALFLLDLGDRANVNVYGPRRDGGGGGDGGVGSSGGSGGGGSGGGGGGVASGGTSSGGADGAPPLYDQQPDEAPLRVPKLTTSGGCGERWPVPFALKGFGTNTWQATMRDPALGGGDKWRWPPQVPRRAKLTLTLTPTPTPTLTPTLDPIPNPNPNPNSNFNQVPWRAKRPDAHWRGAMRDYATCNHSVRSNSAWLEP